MSFPAKFVCELAHACQRLIPNTLNLPYFPRFSQSLLFCVYLCYNLGIVQTRFIQTLKSGLILFPKYLKVSHC